MAWVYNLPPHVATRASRLIGISIACSVLAGAALLLRLYVRIFKVKRVGVDDYMAACSWVSTSISCGRDVQCADHL